MYNMDISHWYNFTGTEWFNDWVTNDRHSKLIRASSHGGLISVLTFGEGVSRKLRIFSGTGSLLMSIQWVVKWMLDAGWTHTLHFVTLLSNGTVRICTLNAKRRQQFTLPFRPIAGKVFQGGFLLFETNGMVHFVSYQNIECLTHERLCSLGQIHLIHGEIPIAIVTQRSLFSNNSINHGDSMDSTSICFSLTTCHKNLIVCKAISNLPSSLVSTSKHLGFVVRNGLLDFYKSLIAVSNEDNLHIYTIDLQKFDEIIHTYTIKLDIIPNSIFIATSYILLNTDNQMYIKHYGQNHRLTTANSFVDNNSLSEDNMLSNTLMCSDDDFYAIGPSSECHIIGFYYSPMEYTDDTNTCKQMNDGQLDISCLSTGESVECEEGIRLLYPLIGEVWLVRSGMGWYKQITDNIENTSYRLLQAYKTFSKDSSEAFTLKINFGEAIYGCIQAAAATLDPALAGLYLEAAVLGRKLNGFAQLSNISNFTTSSSDLNNKFEYNVTNKSISNSVIKDSVNEKYSDHVNVINGCQVDIDKLWASTCGWLRIIHTLAKSPLDQHLTVTEGNSITIERLCEIISARGYPKIAFTISKFSNCSPHLAYHQYAISEILDSSHLPDNDVISAVLNTPVHILPDGVFAKLSKIAASPPFSRNTLALSLYEKERCPYAKAALVNTIVNNDVKITHFPTDLIRIMIQTGIKLPLYYRHYSSKSDLKNCQRMLERMGSNDDAAKNATAIGYSCRNMNKEAKNWFGYSQNFSKASKNQLLHQSTDEMMAMLKHDKQYSSLMDLIFDLFMKNDHSTAMNLASDLGVSRKRLGVCLISSCIFKKDLSILNKYLKDKRVDIPQDLLQQAYGQVDVDAQTDESGSFFKLWK